MITIITSITIIAWLQYSRAADVTATAHGPSGDSI